MRCSFPERRHFDCSFLSRSTVVQAEISSMINILSGCRTLTRLTTQMVLIAERIPLLLLLQLCKCGRSTNRTRYMFLLITTSITYLPLQDNIFLLPVLADDVFHPQKDTRSSFNALEKSRYHLPFSLYHVYFQGLIIYYLL